MKLAIISDIHEDIVSLRLAIARIEKEQCDEIVCLGDISGFSEPYYPYRQMRNAHECLAVVRANCLTIIAGNHDLNAARVIPKISPLFDYPDNWYELDYFEKMEISGGRHWMYEENELDPRYSRDDIRFLTGLPEFKVMTFGDRPVFFSHYLYPNITGALKALSLNSDDINEHHKFVKAQDARLAFAGHEHNPRGCIYTEKGMKYIGSRKMKVTDEETCILIPAIASGPNRNGFCIFDTDNLLLEIKRF
jgi:predicted phosphodiesterase